MHYLSIEKCNVQVVAAASSFFIFFEKGDIANDTTCVRLELRIGCAQNKALKNMLKTP